MQGYRIVSWDYAEPYRQKLVPYPHVNLTFRGGGVQLHGVWSVHRVRVLVGREGMLAVAFRPGCFRPFLGASVATITDRTVDAEPVFGPVPPEPPDVPAVEDYLRRVLPEPDPRATEVAEVVAAIAARRDITRVDALARECGTSVRGLQRRFAEYVGIGPKWVIRRYRLHEVTERLAAGVPFDWAELAADLGYVDQPHLIRDFRQLFGESPTHYAQRY
ncbi:AraC family transcriptional regulator [Actinophytocola xanthii]|uniref:AraC family transcriptional regulator n=1 Tax=Actinophytocola xanthii TaxID=1912961 RepID=A0A1Q8CN72_9PSEU|nr:AraC family transcriptional regulator [Actinophytocola xanthii]